MIQSPQSRVPLAGSGMQINYYPLGSGARLCLAADPSLASLGGSTSQSSIAWDFVNNLLVPYTGAVTISSGTYASTLSVSSGTYDPIGGNVTLTLSAASGLVTGQQVAVSGATGTGSYASINGTQTLLSVTSNTITYYVGTGLTMTITGGTVASGTVTLTLAASQTISPGDTVVVSGATGSGSYASINGSHTAGAGTSGTTLVYSIASGLTMTITGGSLTTGAALPVSVLDIVPANCMTVNYSSITGFANWNYNGAAAVVRI